MAPKRTEIVRQYFQRIFRGPKKLYCYCLVNKYDKLGQGEDGQYGIENKNIELQCGKLLSGEKVSNMKSHLKTRHPQIYKWYLMREQNGKDSNDSVQDPVKKQITNFRTLNQNCTTISVSRPMLIRALLSKVTIDGQPFSSLHDVSFSMFAEPAMKALNIYYDSKNIADLVAEAEQYIRQKLRSDMKNSLVCVKVDCATRHKKSFIGINIQLVKNGEIVVYMLAVKEITVRHTGDNLKKIILQELESFGIQPKHIYTITSDNGANMLKSVQFIEEEQYDDFANDEDIEISGQLMEIISNAKWESDHIMSIRCAAHTLQLCIAETLKKSWIADAEPEIIELIDPYSSIIAKARKIVLELQTLNVMILLHEQNLIIPSLDVPTRWSSTYTMLSGLLPLKEFFASSVRHAIHKLQLTEDEWKLIEEIRLCLEPSYFATKKLQSKSNTLTDVYKIWNICHMQTAAIGSTFSNELVNNMLKRRDALMENVVMLSAIYLDPRFSFELSNDQKQNAVTHIYDVQSRITELQHEKEVQLSLDTEFVTDDDEDTKYEKHLKRKHYQKKQQLVSKPNFKDALLSFGDVAPISHKTEILKFWQDEEDYSVLCNAAQVILSVPGTQVSVEQLFSQLKFIYSDLRSFKLENINNILIVRCNFELLQDFFNK